MKELHIIEIIKNTIITHRDMVLDTLRDSNVRVYNNSSNKDIFNLINLEVNERGNKLLVNNFSLLLNKIYDFSSLKETKEFSNFTSNSPNKIVIVGINNKKKIIELN